MLGISLIRNLLKRLPFHILGTVHASNDLFPVRCQCPELCQRLYDALRNGLALRTF
jgi:hypothetical protein